VRTGSKSPGHKVVTHPSIKGLRFNFDCGHGRNPQIRTCYVDNARRVLRQFREELAALEKNLSNAEKEP
jgi:hypothetical protein